MKKRFLALLAAGTLLLTGCGAQGAANSNAEAGGDGGAEDNLHHLTVVLDWYPNALHAFLYEAQEKGYFAGQGLDVDIQSPAGVNDAMSMVAAGKADIGLYYQQDVIQARAEQNVPIKSIGAVVQGPLNIVLSLKDKNITSPKDLEGKTVSIGASGSGVYYNALDILAAYDLTEDDINAQYQDFGASADALQDGKIDAAFVVAGAPTVAITTLATAKDTYLVGLDDEHIAKLQESSPYYEEYIIPEGTYEGVPETKTVAVVATVIARDDVSEDDVYNICYTIFENMDNLAHDKAGELDVEFASGVTAVPYHAGAAKYFAEKGFDVPTK